MPHNKYSKAGDTSRRAIRAQLGKERKKPFKEENPQPSDAFFILSFSVGNISDIEKGDSSKMESE